MAKRKKSAKPKNLKRKAIAYVLRQLAERDGITIKQAEKRYRNARMEFIFTQSQTKIAEDFYEVSPGKYLRIKKGKPPKAEHTYGRVYKAWEVEKIRRINIYHNTVNILKNALGVSHKEALAYMKRTEKSVKRRLGKTSKGRFRSAVLYSIWVDLGVYKEKSPEIRRK